MNRLLVYLGLLVFVLAFAVWMFFFKDSYELLPIKTTLNEKNTPNEWFEYEAPSGGFKVAFPLLPQVAIQDLKDPTTDEVKHYEIYVTKTEGGSIYMVSLIFLVKAPSDSETSSILKQTMNDMVKAKPDNKLVSSEDVDYQGFKSVNFVIENDQNRMETKEFIKDKTIYVISAITKKDSKEKSYFKNFVESFKLNTK